MNIAIVGFATEGTVSYEYFAAQGHNITICDQNAELNVPEGVQTQLGPDYLHNLDQFDLIVRSAGIHPHMLIDANPGIEPKITTAINEFLRVSPTKNIIGVTGTKGKGTTSTLTTRMLEAAGKRVYLGGNIGRSPLEFLSELNENDWVVLELSSFQLIDLQRSPHIAVCLMVVSEHLDWHPDIEEYFHAKSQLFAKQGAQDIAIYYGNNKNSESIVSNSPGLKIPFGKSPGAQVIDDKITIGNTTICNVGELKLLGKHNWQNVCAAVTAVWQVTQDINAIHGVLNSFTGLEHRLELVRELDGVKYYDDSFGTTPETATVAIEAFAQPKVVILGGSDKGSQYDSLASVISKSDISKIVLIGETAPAIQSALEKNGFSNFVSGGKTMAEIVATAKQHAQPGGVVLLSTGCASFDLFKNYKDRGQQFKDTVLAL